MLLEGCFNLVIAVEGYNLKCDSCHGIQITVQRFTLGGKVGVSFISNSVGDGVGVGSIKQETHLAVDFLIAFMGIFKLSSSSLVAFLSLRHNLRSSCVLLSVWFKRVGLLQR